jgi:hypothetical protein
LYHQPRASSTKAAPPNTSIETIERPLPTTAHMWTHHLQVHDKRTTTAGASIKTIPSAASRVQSTVLPLPLPTSSPSSLRARDATLASRDSNPSSQAMLSDKARHALERTFVSTTASCLTFHRYGDPLPGNRKDTK